MRVSGVVELPTRTSRAKRLVVRIPCMSTADAEAVSCEVVISGLHAAGS